DPAAGARRRPDRQDLDRRQKPGQRRRPPEERRMSPSDTALGPVARAGVGGTPRPNVSFEFSPPKTPEAEAALWEAIGRLAPLKPEFVSVTYGAGGSTRDRTHRTVLRMVEQTELKPAAHLTCVEASRDEVD